MPVTGRRRKEADWDAFLTRLAPLDPIAFLPKVAPRPALLQFGTKDPHFKNVAAAAQADATKQPRRSRSTRALSTS